jgi:mono/diheme cytochrome c family protein
VAASWLDKTKALAILEEAKKKPLDDWMVHAHEAAVAHANGRPVKKQREEYSTTNLKGKDYELFVQGREIYAREGYCITCHQADGRGLAAAGFPPLSGTKWVTGSEDRLIKIILKGIMGQLEVNGKTYPGQVPMTPYGGLLNDREVAAVATFVRNSFGNQAPVVSPDKVKEIRAATTAKKDFYSPTQLLEAHPMEP